MKIIITGTPGAGKSAIAKMLAEKLEAIVINDKEFCGKNRIGKKNRQKELEIPISKFAKKINLFLKKNKAKNILLEGHLFSEFKSKSDLIIVLRAKPSTIEKRLLKKGYSMEKILENSFCEETDYCLRQCKKHFENRKIVEIVNEKGFKQTLSKILSVINASVNEKTAKTSNRISRKNNWI